MNYTQAAYKLMSKYYLLYRGYTGSIMSDGRVLFKDIFFPDKTSFRTAMDELAAEKYKALANSINRAENKLKP